MKWFEPNMSEEALRQRWKTLARKYHPDTSTEPDAEEIFKEISNEYTDIVKGATAAANSWFDEEGATQELYERLNLVARLVAEVFPRLQVTYWAFLVTPTLEFLDPDVPMYKVMQTVEIAQKVLGNARVTVELHRACRKKKFTCVWDKDTRTLFIDCSKDGAPTTWSPKGQGRRYKEYENLRFERVHDTKFNISYVKVKSPTVELRKDFMRV